MAVLAAAVVPACGERDEGMLRLAAEHFGAFDFKAQPGALGTPVSNRLAIEPALLGGQGGGHQVIDQAQHVGAVARAHQGFGAGCRMSGMVMAAAGIEQGAAAARANGCTHCVTTSISQSFPDWPRTAS